MQTIWLVRHGETLFNIEAKLQGMSDSPLTTVGLKQIDLLAKFLSCKPIDKVFSSDLLRAKITAQQIAAQHQNMQIIFNQNLRERSFGIFEGKAYQSYRDRVGDKHKLLDFSVDRGESLLSVCSRAQIALNQILEQDFKECVVVAHGSFNRCFLGTASGCPSSEWLEFKQHNCCVNKLVKTSTGKFRIEILNESNHLDF